MLLQKVSPTVNPPKSSQTSVERDHRGTIKIDINDDYKNPKTEK